MTGETLEAVAKAIKNAPKERRIVVQGLRMGADGVVVKEHETIEFVQTDESRAKAAIAAHDSELKKHIKVLVEANSVLEKIIINLGSIMKRTLPPHIFVKYRGFEYEEMLLRGVKQALASLPEELRGL